MPVKRDRPGRPVVGGAASEPGYPALREHLASRRDVLTFVGASVVTGFLGCGPKGKLAGPSYYTFRLPETGELQTTLASGEVCRFYVNGAHYGDYRSSYLAEEPICVDTLAEHTADELVTTSGRHDAERALFDELALRIDGLDQLTLTIVEPQS
jgi:hypothetical protein